jgi:hypothetical protein
MTMHPTRRLFIRNTLTGIVVQLAASTLITPVLQPKLREWYQKLIRIICEGVPHAVDA